MIPESKLIKSELTLREMSLPTDVKLARKSLVRWIALSLGLILPNESRTLLLDILDVILSSHVKNEYPTTKDIIEKLEAQLKNKQNPKAVYYHLLRLKETGFLSRKKGRYYLGDGEEQKLSDIFRKIYSSKAESAFSRIDEALNKLEGSYQQ